MIRKTIPRLPEIEFSFMILLITINQVHGQMQLNITK